MHKHKIAHRGIRARNILVSSEGQVKLTGMGVWMQLPAAISLKTANNENSYWMSPELIKKNEHTIKSDIWALGITTIEMAEGEPPYYNINPISALSIIQDKPASSLTERTKWSPEFNSFVEMCLQKDPRHRPSTVELLAHPFILGNKGRDQLVRLVKIKQAKELEEPVKLLPEDLTLKVLDLGKNTESFDEELEAPAEYKGYSEERLENILKKLHADMNAEIDFIKREYKNRIIQVKKAMKALPGERKAEHSFFVLTEDKIQFERKISESVNTHELNQFHFSS